jgi:Uma2 family endonuclease
VRSHWRFGSSHERDKRWVLRGEAQWRARSRPLHVMMSPMEAVEPRLTYPELRLMPDDGKRYELIDGEVFVCPSPSEKHQSALARLHLSMGSHAQRKKLGKVYFAPFDVVFGEKTAVQPDLLFVSSARLGIIGPEYVLGAPDLIVEILSPSRASYDRVTKLEVYASHGVREYWLIDPVAESVEIYVLVGKKYRLKGTFTGADVLRTPLLPGWELRVSDLFSA